MNQPAIMWQGDNIMVIVDNRPYTVNKNTHPFYTEIVTCIRDRKWDDLPTYLDINRKLETWFEGNIKIDKEVVSYCGRPVPEAMGNMLVNLIKNKIDHTYFVKFIENLMKNPSKKSIDQLYIFLERNQMPITEDGCFMAYKAVDEGYMSKYADKVTGEKVRYMIGDKPSMPRNLISDDSDVMCDQGLHACSMEYLRSWSATHLMLVKINPANVVSIPKDHNFTKMRVCEMEVVAEVLDENGDKWYKTANFNNDVLGNQMKGGGTTYTDEEIEAIRREAFDIGRYTNDDLDNDGLDDGGFWDDDSNDLDDDSDNDPYGFGDDSQDTDGWPDN